MRLRSNGRTAATGGGGPWAEACPLLMALLPPPSPAPASAPKLPKPDDEAVRAAS
jgi:hypothetical protein